MAIDIGRTGSLGLAVENVAGYAITTMDVYLECAEMPTLRGHHEPLENISSKSSRFIDKNSVIGKRWTEGDVQILADVVNSGWLWYLALGNELLTTGTPNYHTFYPTVSGNTPKTATLIYTRGSTDVEQYAYAAMDELTLEIPNGELATLSASFQAQFPTTGAAQTVTTTSGTFLSFKDYFIQFGTTLTVANAAAATPISEFSLTLSNNLEVIHRSGSADVSTIRSKGMKVEGSYTLFFDSITDRDAYYALQKRAMIVTASGNLNENMQIRIPQFRLNEAEVSTGLDDFYTIQGEFVAEDVIDASIAGQVTRLIDVKLGNTKSTTYT